METDNLAQQIIEKLPKDDSPFEYRDRLLWFQGKVYVPAKERQFVLEQYHETPTQGHQGVDKTIEKIIRIWYIPRICKEVNEYIAKCDTCARTKHSRHKPYGELQTPTTPGRAWASIAFDFIVKLPPSQEPMTKALYDAILVITDRLTKYGYFIPYKESSTAEDLAYAFLRVVIANHGMLVLRA